MKFHFNAFFRDISPDGQGTAVLEFLLEHPETAYRDMMMAKIMSILNQEEETEVEQKQGVFGFEIDHEEEDGEDEGATPECKPGKKKK